MDYDIAEFRTALDRLVSEHLELGACVGEMRDLLIELADYICEPAEPRESVVTAPKDGEE